MAQGVRFSRISKQNASYLAYPREYLVMNYGKYAHHFVVGEPVLVERDSANCHYKNPTQNFMHPAHFVFDIRKLPSLEV